MQVLEQGKGPTVLQNLDLVGVQMVRRSSISRWTGSLADVSPQRLPSVLETLFFPFCLKSVEHYEVEHHSAYLGHLLYFRSKVHDILGAGDKTLP